MNRSNQVSSYSGRLCGFGMTGGGRFGFGSLDVTFFHLLVFIRTPHDFVGGNDSIR